MKRVTASEARRNWFRILDEVAAGEIVVVERNGRTIRISRESRASRASEPPDYTDLLRVPAGAEHADRWGWAWSEDGGDLQPVEDDPS